MQDKQYAESIVDLLEKEYPDARCSLQYARDYELLFSVRLAAQCTDERVNKITPALFEAFPSLEAFAKAAEEEIEPYIHSCGLSNSKARDISLCSKMLVERFSGKVPDSMEDLLKLPGVGRKTANLILGDIFEKPGSVVVDTHCIRLSNRMGLADSKDPVKIEKALRDLLPPEKSNDFCHRLVIHGRAVCTARKPFCEKCCINSICRYCNGEN